ncbi:MAG TPA: RTX toxin [Cyanothece sp. UBA12306]|nr:RTX toxin [Cyanothece sp. UBA12306]
MDIVQAPNTHHNSFLSLVPHGSATHIAINNGSWFDPNTWQDGIVPTDNSNVLISEGVTVTYEQESDARLKTVRIDGNLSFAQDKNTKIIVDYIAVSNSGNLEIGTETNPIQNNTAQIIFASVDPNNASIDLGWDPHQFSRGLVTGHGASVSIVGAEKTPYMTLAGNQLAGSTELVFSEPISSDWKVGDQIVLTGTQWDHKGSHEDNSKTQDEVLTIESINGNKITFSHNDVDGNALRFDHTTPEGFGVDIYVANLSRNISFATEGGDSVPISQRGHLMFMGQDVGVHNAGFYELGRTNKDVVLNDPEFDSEGNLIPGTGTNARGRYSLHFHQTLLDMNGEYNHSHPPAQVTGNAVWGNPGWGYVAHTSAVNFEDNVSFDVLGAHFVTEEGDEQASFRRNIAIKAEGAVTDAPTNLLQPKDERGLKEDWGSEGLGLWGDTSYSITAFEDNIITGTKDSGIIVYGHNDVHVQPDVPVSTLPPELQKIVGNDTTIASWKVPVRNFSNNKVYNADGGIEIRGVTRDDNALDGNNIGHNEQSIFEGFDIWGVRRHGIQTSYAGRITLKDALIVGDPENPLERTKTQSTADSPKGVGIYSQKNARYMIYDNVHVEGFTIGATIPQTSIGGYNDENNLSASQLIGGTFANNTYNLEAASGKIDNFSKSTVLNPFNNSGPLTPYFMIKGNPIFEVPLDDHAPVAEFTANSVGGLALLFDGSDSFDPDYIPDWTDSKNNPYTAGDNTIAGFAWDFDGDGNFDDFGRYVTHIYDTPGTYSITLKVTDIQGNTSTRTQEISIDAQSFPNIVLDGTFSVSDFKKTGSISNWGDIGHSGGWNIAGSHRWNKDSVNGWAYADDSGSPGLTQVIYNEGISQGLQTISFDAKNLGSDNTLRLQVYGINGRFEFSKWDYNSPTNTHNTIPFESVTLLDTGNVATTEFDWQTLTWNNVDFGEGYEFIGIRFSTRGVSETEFQAIDNFSIGTSPTNGSNSIPIAVNDTFTTDEDTPIVIDVLANDFDVDGNPLSIALMTQPQDGTVIDNNNGTLTFTPNANFFGETDFSYTVSDGQGALHTATVNLTVNPVNDAPVLYPDFFNTAMDTPVVIHVLKNDRELEGENLTLTSFSQSQNGSLLHTENGRFSYTPNTGFIGNDTFTYTVTDDQGTTSTTTAQITVSESMVLPGNLIKDNSFNGVYGQTFLENGSNADWQNAGQVWLRPGGHKWNKDVNNEWATADGSGASGLIQVIQDNNSTQGLQDLSFDAIHTGLENTLRLQVYGIDGQFTMSNWDTNTPVSVNSNPINVETLLDTKNVATDNFDWQTFYWDSIDFNNGYEYVVLRLTTAGVSDTEFLAIDDLFLGQHPNSNPPINLIKDGNFTVDNGETFLENGPNADWRNADQGWVRPRGHRWNKDVNNEWATADDSGASGLTQVIQDNNTTQGLQNLSFDAIHTGLENTLRLQVYGIDGQFSMSNWNTDTPVSYNSEPINVATILDTQNLATENFDLQNFSWDTLDFNNGYEYIVLRFTTQGVSDNELLAIDNVFLGQNSNNGTSNSQQFTPNNDPQTSINKSRQNEESTSDNSAEINSTISTSVNESTQDNHTDEITYFEGSDHTTTKYDSQSTTESDSKDELLTGNDKQDIVTGGGNDLLTSGGFSNNSPSSYDSEDRQDKMEYLDSQHGIDLTNLEYDYVSHIGKTTDRNLSLNSDIGSILPEVLPTELYPSLLPNTLANSL